METVGQDHFRVAEAQAQAQLTASLARLEWALEHPPPTWHHRPPGGVVGFPTGDAWGVARNIAHLTVYEERLGAPRHPRPCSYRRVPGQW